MAWPPGFEPAGEAWPTGFAAPQPVNRREMARQEIALGGVDDSGVPSRDKSTQLQWFETKIRPALEQIAHPQTVNDFAALLIPDIRLSKANVAAMMEAVKKLPVPTGRQVLSAYKAVRHPARTIATAIGDKMAAMLEAHLGSAEASARDVVSNPGYPRLTETPPPSQPVVAPSAAVAPAPSGAAPAMGKVVQAGPFNPSVALQQAKEAFAAIGETPQPAEASNAMELIRRGKSPGEAVVNIISHRRPMETPPSAPSAGVSASASSASSMVKLTADEMKVGMDLMARGKTPQEALEAILAQRQLRERMGALSNTQVRQALDLRHDQGAIKTPSAETARARRGQ